VFNVVGPGTEVETDLRAGVVGFLERLRVVIGEILKGTVHRDSSTSKHARRITHGVGSTTEVRSAREALPEAFAGVGEGVRGHGMGVLTRNGQQTAERRQKNKK
jgi:hypothetical protein